MDFICDFGSEGHVGDIHFNYPVGLTRSDGTSESYSKKKGKRAANGRPVNLRSDTRIGAELLVNAPFCAPFQSHARMKLRSFSMLFGRGKLGCERINHIDRATRALLWEDHAGRKGSSGSSQMTPPSLAARTL